LAQNPNKSIISIGDIKAAWKVIAQNWYIPLILVVISGAAGQLYSYKQTDVYAAKCQIFLKSNNNINTSSIISDNFYGGGTYIDNSNEMRVISSYDLVKKVLDRLDFDVSYFIVGRIRTVELADGMPFKVKMYSLNSALYEQQIKLKILDVNRFEISYKKNGLEIKKTGLFNTDFVDTDFRLRINSTQFLNISSISGLHIVEYMFQIHNHDALVYAFKYGLQVSNPDYTNILEVSLEDVLQQRAVMFLDTLAQVYIENTVRSKIEVNNNTLRYIDKQMREVTSILNEIEDTMQGFREKNNILDLTREGQEYYSKLTSFDNQKAETNVKLGVLNDLENYIISGKDQDFLPPSVYIMAGDQFLQTHVNELFTLQITRMEAKVATKEGSPAIQSVDDRIEKSKKDMLIYIGNMREALKRKVEEADSEIALSTSRIRTLPYKERGLVNIQRKLNVNETMYTFLLQKRSNTVIAQATIIPETKIIESARSIGLVKPDRKKIVTNFVFASVIISLIIISIRTIVFSRIESIDELKMKTRLAVVGEVMFVPLQKDLIIAAESDPKSPIAESFRTVRTNLQFMTTSGRCKVIVITSNNPGEGKTFCSLNLAGILAKAGKRVLILELDLHKPRIQKGLNLEADNGISTIVIGKNTIAECVKKTAIENMEVILSGPLPPNPSEIVLAKELEDIFTFGREHYDYVIVDTPPVGLISDATILMKLADVSLFVINTRFPFKDSLQNAEEIVEMNKLLHFGFILNGVKRRKSKYYYNKYGYSYGGYGSYGNYGGYGGYGSYKGSQDKNA